MKRLIADEKPGFPDRVELRDVEQGEALLLLNYLHQPADTPYKASHAIFVREWAETPYRALDEIPDVLRIRPISLRAFDASGDMVDADLIRGRPQADDRASARQSGSRLHPCALRQARLLCGPDRSGVKGGARRCACAPRDLRPWEPTTRGSHALPANPPSSCRTAAVHASGWTCRRPSARMHGTI